MGDNVNHPAHYCVGGIETIDYIVAKELNYLAGNVIKYVSRYEHKGKPLEDLHKARFYLNRLIEEVERDMVYAPTPGAGIVVTSGLVTLKACKGDMTCNL